ncbi:MAG: nucleotidyltransferase family protein [Actinobacteria bacterium]|nr:nucleotidyltransferase family protein [Actinomycetota bacterium]
MTVAAVVLAAGGGERFAGATHKLLAPFRGQPLVTWAVDAAARAGLHETVVVVGAGAEGVRAVLPPSVEVLVNDQWKNGIATSLRLAVAHARHTRHAAIVVGLGDQPFVAAEAFRRVAAYDERPIGVATYGGERRNPVRLAEAVWSLVPREGDEGMRAVMRLNPDLVGEVPCPGQGVDIDTVEDLELWS